MANCAEISCGWKETDLIIIQLTQPDPFNNWITPAVTHGWSETKTGNWFVVPFIQTKECCIIDYADYVVDAYVGYNNDTQQTYQVIKIDPTLLPNEFYIQFTFRNLDNTEYSLFTEHYKKVNCNIETDKIKGVFNDYDCENHFYNELSATFGTPDIFNYENEIRLVGELNYVGESIEQTRSNRIYLAQTIKKSTYQLVLAPLAPYMAKRLANILTAKHIYIDGKEYVYDGGDFEKNNTIGKMFHLVLKFSDIECEIIHEC